MLLFILKVLLLLVGLLLAAVQFLSWFVKKKRDEVSKIRTRLAIVWVALLLVSLVKIRFFR